MCQCTCGPSVITTRDIIHEGRTLTVTVVEDIDATIDGYDCFDSDEIAAWRRDEWGFVGVLVTDGGKEIDALWAVVYGRLNAETVITMDEIISDHPVPDMLRGK